MQMDTDVLIVGAGPVGLTMACFLFFHGIPFRIIDKNAHGTETSNAIGVQSRTLELLTSLGIADKLISKGNKLNYFHLQSDKKELAVWKLDFISSIFPFLLSVSQKITEQTLLDYLTESGVKIERNTELLALSQDNEKVTVQLKSEGKKTTVTAKYLSACDGFKSTIRGLLNVEYQGVDMPLLNMLIIDAPLSMKGTKNNGYTAFTETLSVILLPLENSWRIIADVAKEPEFHCKGDQKPTEEMFQKILDRTMKDPIKIGKALWASKFLIHERIAKQFRVGRVFLLGDAAHAHSPAGAQGMNTGMQDAVNLAWKLAFVLKGQASDLLLNSYELERRPVAEKIIQFSGLLLHFGTTRNRFLIALRNILLPKISRISFVQKKFANNLSQRSICYDNSPIVAGKTHSNLKPGSPMPMMMFNFKEHVEGEFYNVIGKKFILLDFKGDAKILTESYPDRVSYVAIQPEMTQLIKEFGMEHGGYVIIRPDQYIAYMGEKHDEIIQLFQKMF